MFKLTPNHDRVGWTETVLYSFTGGADGAGPTGGLVFDAAGNLYGTAFDGGSCFNGGTAFQLVPNRDGTWTQNVIYRFACTPNDAFRPDSTLIFDSAGNLYGESQSGGSAGGYGTVFKLTPSSGGQWSETVLHSFAGGFQDGDWPDGGLGFDSAGNIYGTTVIGGLGGFEHGGIVFQITP